MKIKLIDIAHARSGDKGDAGNVGVIAKDDRAYALIEEHLTEELVHRHFAPLGVSAVKRYPMPNLKAVNFILENALGGGGTVSLKLDAQGKTLAAAMLRLELDI